MIRLVAMEMTEKKISVRVKVRDLFHDRARGLGPYALNDCGLGCCLDFRGTYLGESRMGPDLVQGCFLAKVPQGTRTAGFCSGKSSCFYFSLPHYPSLFNSPSVICI